MLVLSLLLLAWFGLSACAQEEEKYVRVSVVHKRDGEAATCASTYGDGSEPCGGADSTYCFNPSSGQSCCAADNGFCDAGKYCAPVGGYCCFEGEDIETCARNAGFTLPNSVSNASSTGANAIVASTTVASPTLTVVPFLKESSVPPAVDIEDCGSPEPMANEAISNSNSNTSAPTIVVSHTNGTNPALVQVSLARRQADVRTRSMVMVGIVGILTTIF